jgi:hypothetical protein
LAIAALFLWVLTAGAGLSLLSSGRAARDRVTRPAPAAGPVAGPGQTPAGPAQTDGPPAGPAQAPAGPAQAPADSAQRDGPPARYAALPLTEDGRPPPGPHVKVAAPPGEHPLLQFSHPALALTGLAFWLAFVLVRYRPLAWISFGILVVTAGAGLGWLAGNALAARRRPGAARTFPPRLIVLHGLAAAATLALTALTALSAGHG